MNDELKRGGIDKVVLRFLALCLCLEIGLVFSVKELVINYCWIFYLMLNHYILYTCNLS